MSKRSPQGNNKITKDNISKKLNPAVKMHVIKSPRAVKINKFGNMAISAAPMNARKITTLIGNCEKTLTADLN
jgi:hypothetical protein